MKIKLAVNNVSVRRAPDLVARSHHLGAMVRRPLACRWAVDPKTGQLACAWHVVTDDDPDQANPRSTRPGHVLALIAA